MPPAAGLRPHPAAALAWLRRGWRRLRPGSLHGRLLATVPLVVLASVAALGAHTAATGTALALDSLRHQGSAIARSVALASAGPLKAAQHEGVEPVLLGQAAYPGVVSLLVLDGRGRVVGQAQPDGEGQPRLVLAPPQPLPLPPASGRAETLLLDLPAPARVVAWHPVATDGGPGWVRVELRPDALHTLSQGLLWRTLAACLAAVAGSALALRWMLRGPRRALAEAQDFAAALTRSDGRQLALDPDGPRETVALGRALNEASRRLGEQAETLRATLDALARQRAELHDSHLQLASVFALSPDGLVTFDADGRVRHANPAFCRLTGLAADAVVGWRQAELEAHLRVLCADPLDWLGLEDCFAAGAGRCAGADTADAPRLRLAAPQARTLSLLGRQALRDDADTGAGSVTRLLYLRDVTREAELDRMKSEFLSTAAHELRTPLASIHGFAELLCHREFEPARRAQMLAAIHRNSGVMAHILNDLLDLARIEARQGADFRFLPQDLGALVAGALADHAVPPGREAPRLLAAGGALPVRADEGKIAQVLGNLLGNAYKYSPQGGPVAVRLLRDLAPGEVPRVGFEVSDSGIGMSAVQVARVFDRFYRADPSGAIQGTGLGMSIVQEIVTLHGGEVRVHSRPGEGTAVTVWLPLRG